MMLLGFAPLGWTGSQAGSAPANRFQFMPG